jgi:hypothetical protein
LTAATHALGNEGALILSHRAADLEQQLVVGVIATGSVEKLHLAAGPLQLFE